MASGIIWTPGERTTQPQEPVGVNWSDPQARNLVFQVAGANALFNSANRRLGVALVGGASRQADSLRLVSPSNGDASFGTQSLLYGATAATFELQFKVDSLASGQTIFASWNSVGTSFIAGYVQTAGSVGFLVSDDIGSITSLRTADGTVSAGVICHVVWSWAAGSNGQLYINGSPVSGSAWADNGSATAIKSGDTTPWQFGRQVDGNPVVGGNLYVARVWRRELSSNDALDVYKNRWRLFEADSDPVFYSLGGGSNNTATLNSTLAAATLAGVGSVTRSGTLAVTLDAATLTGVGGVTRSGTLSTTLADATLTGIGAVTRNGTLEVTLDAATLSGEGTVAVGTSRDGVLSVTLDNVTVAGVGAVTRSATLAVTLDNATLAGIGTAGQPRTGTLAVTLDNVTLSGIGAIPVALSQGGGTGTGRNLSRKQKKKLKAVESQEWLKAEETARQLLNDRFTKQTPQEKAEALQTYVESLQPIIEALKALTTQIEEVKEVVEDAPIIELTPHQEILSRFDTLEKKLKSVEELVIILMADL